MTETRFRQAFLLLLVTAISAAFVAMIRAFLLTILLAAIFAGLSYPVYQWLLGRLRGREALAAIATLVLLLALVMAPLLAVLGAGANEALRVTETIRPRLQQLVDQPGEFDSRLRALPGYHRIEPYRAQILTKAGELVGSTSAFLFAALSATTRATAVFIFQFFVLLYTMFFFLTGGPGLLRAFWRTCRSPRPTSNACWEKFVSVTRATLKGTILIGAAQGVLGGLAFWAVGLDGAIFWGTVMTVLSIIPGIGGALDLGAGGDHPRHHRRGLARHRPRRVLRARRRKRGQPAAAAAGRPGHQDARAAHLLLDARRPPALRRDGLHPGPHPGGALRHRVGDVRHGVPQRARRTGFSCGG